MINREFLESLNEESNDELYKFMDKLADQQDLCRSILSECRAVIHRRYPIKVGSIILHEGSEYLVQSFSVMDLFANGKIAARAKSCSVYAVKRRANGVGWCLRSTTMYIQTEDLNVLVR